MFGHPRNLFINSDGSQMQFAVLKCSADFDIVSILIMWGGGSVCIRDVPAPNVINLSCKLSPWMSKYELFSTSFIYSCCRNGCIMNIETFRIGKCSSTIDTCGLNEKLLPSPSNGSESIIPSSYLNGILQEASHSMQPEQIGKLPELPVTQEKLLGKLFPKKKLLTRRKRNTKNSPINSERSSTSTSSVPKKPEHVLVGSLDEEAKNDARSSTSMILPEDSASMIKPGDGYEASSDRSQSIIKVQKESFSRGSDHKTWMLQVYNWLK